MLNFPILPGDKYDGRCAEIYITEKQFLIFHCSVCEEIYATFNELLSHITKDHFNKAKEYSEIETRSEEPVIAEENQLAVRKSFINTKNSKGVLDGSLAVKSKREEREHKQFFNEYLQETADETTKLKVQLEIKDISPLSKYNKSFPQHKKKRNITGALKFPIIGRTKINTRYQINPSEELKYICDICGFAFKDKYNLRGHLLRHANQKKYSCSMCQKRFFTKIDLRLHEYRHKEDRSFLCNHCGMGFLNSGSLTLHIRKYHSLRRSFKYEQCNRVSNFYKVKDQQPVYSEDRYFQCSECPLTFKCRNTFNNHMKLNENKHKYRCENCDLDLSDAIGLNNYQRKNSSFIKKSAKEIMIQTHIMQDNDKKEDNYINDNLSKRAIGEVFFTEEQNFDEYELVQTLTDLECNKTI